MSHEIFNGEQIGTILIQMCAESMSERVAGNLPLPSKSVLVSMDMSGKEEGINGTIFTILFREKITFGFAAFKSVLCQSIQCSF